MSALPELEEECFFIAPIGQDDSEERYRSDGVLEFIVGRAAEEIGLQAVRADQLAEPGQITLQVIDHVLGAKAAVADLTGRNPNVFYELAIRHTAKLPTVLICEQGERLPFDIAQMRTIFFRYNDLRSADRCRSDIVQHLRQALNGAVDSPVAASVDLQRLRAGNTVERSVAELVTNVSELERALANVVVEVRQTRRSMTRDRVWEDNMVRQYVIAQDVNRQLRDLRRLAHERKDTELERIVSPTVQLGTALVLSFPAEIARRVEADRDAPTGEELVRLARDASAPPLREKLAEEADSEAPEDGDDRG